MYTVLEEDAHRSGMRMKIQDWGQSINSEMTKQEQNFWEKKQANKKTLHL